MYIHVIILYSLFHVPVLMLFDRHINGRKVACILCTVYLKDIHRARKVRTTRLTDVLLHALVQQEAHRPYWSPEYYSKVSLAQMPPKVPITKERLYTIYVISTQYNNFGPALNQIDPCSCEIHNSSTVYTRL